MQTSPTRELTDSFPWTKKTNLLVNEKSIEDKLFAAKMFCDEHKLAARSLPIVTPFQEPHSTTDWMRKELGKRLVLILKKMIAQTSMFTSSKSSEGKRQFKTHARVVAETDPRYNPNPYHIPW